MVYKTYAVAFATQSPQKKEGIKDKLSLIPS
jgi:hypothetical protein